MNARISRLTRFFALTCALLFAFAATAEAGKKPRKAKIKVASYNLYVGASIFRVFDPPACGVPQAVFDIHSIIQQTDFPVRAEAIADEIAQLEPHVIGLQEVTTLRTGPADSLTPAGIEWLPPESCTTAPCFTFKTNAENVSYDYLQILLDALAAGGEPKLDGAKHTTGSPGLKLCTSPPTATTSPAGSSSCSSPVRRARAEQPS